MGRLAKKRARRSTTIRNRALILLPVVAVFLVADLAEPGFGKFPNPVFYGQWAFNEATGAAQKLVEDDSNIGDERLTLCQGDPQNDLAGNKTDARPSLSDTQAALRETLTGESSVMAVQQWGTPICQLADGTWRWLLESGLSLDVQVADDGTIADAELTH